MDAKRITLIVSDLHMGDGRAGDDFVDDAHQFAKFVLQQAGTPEGQAGQIELIINGDFLEFVQVYPEAYQLNSPEYWCSEKESVWKLNSILQGHADVFDALKKFQETHNRVTLFAGNHDVDLYWKDVQDRIRQKAGEVNFELREAWYERYGGKLRISHGHLFESIDPANGFKHWDAPFLGQPNSLVQRLEMCPGTLFVVRFVNFLEDKYPFADNLHPETTLAEILWREDRWGLKTIAWVFGRFVRQFPKAFLGTEQEMDFGQHLRHAISLDPILRGKIARIYREVLQDANTTPDMVKARLSSEEAIADFIEQLLRRKSPWEDWVQVLDLAKPGTSSIGAHGSDTLAIRAASKINTRQECVKVAKDEWRKGAQVVVLGHTHLPQSIEEGARSYYNPGSWTRYVDAEDAESLTLEKLQREDQFPYQLNCVRIEDDGSGTLASKLIVIEERRPD
jgi:UDP-2,3-diacylglucosamine pyrophosphatase LpxH